MWTKAPRALGICLVVLGLSSVSSTNYEVPIWTLSESFTFDNLVEGDTIHWDWTGSSHNVQDAGTGGSCSGITASNLVGTGATGCDFPTGSDNGNCTYTIDADDAGNTLCFNCENHPTMTVTVTVQSRVDCALTPAVALGADNCTADCGTLTAQSITPGTNGGDDSCVAADPHVCADGDGDCVIANCTLTPAVAPVATSCTADCGTLTQVRTPGIGGGDDSCPAAADDVVCADGDGDCVIVANCTLTPAVAPVAADCTADCGTLTQVRTPGTGGGDDSCPAAADDVVCADGDGACRDDDDDQTSSAAALWPVLVLHGAALVARI